MSKRSRGDQKPPPYELDPVQRAIAAEKAEAREAGQAARKAGAAAVFLQSLLGAVVEKAGGVVTLTPADMDAFAHGIPVQTARDPEGTITLRANPIRPAASEELEEAAVDESEDEGGEVVHPTKPASAGIGLCQRCGQDQPLLHHTRADGSRVIWCGTCILIP